MLKSMLNEDGEHGDEPSEQQDADQGGDEDAYQHQELANVLTVTSKKLRPTACLVGSSLDVLERSCQEGFYCEFSWGTTSRSTTSNYPILRGHLHLWGTLRHFFTFCGHPYG